MTGVPLFGKGIILTILTWFQKSLHTVNSQTPYRTIAPTA